MVSTAERRRFEEAASETYNYIGPDAFGGNEAPDEGKFVDVIHEFIYVYGGLSDADLELWASLPYETKREIVLTAL